MEPNPRVTIPIRPATPEMLDHHRGMELDTIEAMFRIYCRDHHGRDSSTCDDCAPLLDYATRRLVRCVFGAAKPTCANCAVHCYTETMRVRIREVMRYAGPRMMWRHPMLALNHVLAGRRDAPRLPSRKRPRASAALAPVDDDTR